MTPTNCASIKPISNLKLNPLTLDEATRQTTTEPDAEVKAWQDEQTRQKLKEGLISVGLI
jgi:hypothetical protein